MAEIDFAGKVAVVTGASRGIGRVIALGLARRGAAVVGAARRLDFSPGVGGTLEETFAMIEAAGGAGLAVPGSITDAAGVRSLLAQAQDAFGRIDILVNNAGMHPGVSVTKMTDGQWNDMIAVNLTAPFLLMREVVPIMKAQGSGNILNVSSGAGSRSPRADNTGYGATKAALDRMSFNLAHELKDDGIAVNAWLPGVLATDMNAGRQPGEPVGLAEESVMWIVAQTPATFTGRVVRREELGNTWGPGAPEA